MIQQRIPPLVLRLPMPYEPIFQHGWPNETQARWEKIRQFLSVWCFGDSLHWAAGAAIHSRTASSLEKRLRRKLATSLRNWFDLLDNHAGDDLLVRDVTEVSQLSDHMEWVDQSATVILMQGERDLFWTVLARDLGKEDPPVYAYQCFDRGASPLLGIYPSVSQFALQYLCTYNDFGRSRIDAFQLDLKPADAASEIYSWFSNRLILADESMEFCSRCHLLEHKDCVAIRSGNRLKVSVFAEPDELELPNQLQLALEKELRERAEHEEFMASIRSKKSS